MPANKIGMHDFPIYLDNIIFSLQKAGGISVYWLELIKRLALSHEQLVVFEHGGAARNFFRNKLSGKFTIRHERGAFPALAARYLPLMAQVENHSIFHSSYYRISVQKNVANIITAYDFTYERFRNGLPRFVHYWQKRIALNLADGIICISASTKKDLLRYFPSLKNKEITVIYLGVSEAFHVLKYMPPVDENIREIIAAKYVMFIGARTAYKNFAIVVDVVSRIPDCRLLVIGGGKFTPQEGAYMEHKLSGRFRHLQDVDDYALNVLYNHAFCLLYPSSYEGFGMPLIEAMSAGCPVVAVNVSSIPEAAGDAGLLVARPEPEAFLEKIAMLENQPFREQVVKKGLAHAAGFSWDLCCRQTKEFYRRVFARKFGVSLNERI